MTTPETEPRAQRAFLADLAPRLRADRRIRAAWLIGSLARGTADAYSDVDLLLAIAGDALPAIVADWRGFVADLAPTITLQRLGGDDKPTLAAIAPGLLRFDLTLCDADSAQQHGYDHAELLFDHDGVAARTTFAPRPAGQAAGQLPGLAREFLRILGLTPVALGRGELLVSRQGLAILQNLLIDLFLLENGGRPGGVKHLNRYLTAEQRDALAACPPLELTRDALLGSIVAVARLFLPRARRLMRAHDLPYPEAFEREVLEYLRRTLGVAPW